MNLMLKGSGFSTRSTVVFSDSAIIVQSVRSVSAGSLEATVVLSARPGTYGVRVSDPAGTSAEQRFSIVPTAVGGAAEWDVTPFAGSATTGLDEPYKAWADAAYLYITEYAHSTVTRISLSGGLLTTLAGERDKFGAVDGAGVEARLGRPAGIWADGSSVFVTDAYFDTVRRISLTTGEVTTIAGSPTSESGASDGMGAAARFRSPNGIWGDGVNLYVCDRLNFTIRKIVIATGQVTTLAGNAQSRGVVDGVGTSAMFYAPTDIWGDGANLYVADGSAIRKVTIAGGIVRTLAGNASTPDYSTSGFSFIGGIWGDGASLYVADTGNNAVRKISLDTGSVTTAAGSPLEVGSGNGIGSQASFHNPADVVGDGTNIYILDSLNSTIRRAISPSTSELTFRLQDRAGSSLMTSGTKSTPQVGYAQVVLDAGSATPSGLAIFGYRQNGTLISEMAVAATRTIRHGRIPVEIEGAVNTGIAIANSNSKAVTLDFYFTDADGATLYSGSASIPANGQMAAFLDQFPFAPPANIALKAIRTFTFSTSSPIAVTALRGFTNERSEFLMTTLPIAAFEPAGTSPIVFPHFAAGGGWKTEIVLVNPADSTLSGILEFHTQLNSNAQSTDDPLIINGAPDHRFSYNIAARSSVKVRTSGAGSIVQTGWVRVIPSGSMPAPSGLLVFSFQNNGITISEAGVPALPEASAFLLYAETSGQFHLGEPGAIQSGIAISNSAAAPAAIRLDLLGLDGSQTGLFAEMAVPPMGQVALFLNQIPGFANLQTPFQGFLRITGAPVAVTGLRGRYNERRDFLFAATPAMVEDGGALVGELIFPHFADGGGYTTQFILHSGSTSLPSIGKLRFVGQTGQEVSLSVGR